MRDDCFLYGLMKVYGVLETRSARALMSVPVAVSL